MADKCRNLRSEIEMAGEDGTNDKTLLVTDEGNYGARIAELQKAIWDMEERLKLVEEAFSTNPQRKNGDATKFITKQEMVEMVRSAISQGSPAFGVSRVFIRKLLYEQYAVPITAYYTKKLNFVLQSAIKEGIFTFDSTHQLYKLV